MWHLREFIVQSQNTFPELCRLGVVQFKEKVWTVLTIDFIGTLISSSGASYACCLVKPQSKVITDLKLFNETMFHKCSNRFSLWPNGSCRFMWNILSLNTWMKMLQRWPWLNLDEVKSQRMSRQLHENISTTRRTGVKSFPWTITLQNNCCFCNECKLYLLRTAWHPFYSPVFMLPLCLYWI